LNSHTIRTQTQGPQDVAPPYWLPVHTRWGSPRRACTTHTCQLQWCQRTAAALLQAEGLAAQAGRLHNECSNGVKQVCVAVLSCLPLLMPEPPHTRCLLFELALQLLRAAPARSKPSKASAAAIRHRHHTHSVLQHCHLKGAWTS